VSAAKEVFGVQGTGPKADRFLTRSVRANGLVFTTLHHGWDPADYDPTVESGSLPDDLGEQTRNVLEELGKVLAEAGSGLDRVLRANVYVNSPAPDALDQVDAAYHAFFRERGLDEPAVRTTHRVQLMDPGVAMDLVAAA
jgi:enamine deaminase RidA (YjgF/YER057c/UK114 family)